MVCRRALQLARTKDRGGSRLVGGVERVGCRQGSQRFPNLEAEILQQHMASMGSEIHPSLSASIALHRETAGQL